MPPSSINWNTDEATHYKYRQDTGADLNSLGFVRINIPNPYGVYMHDTPSKGIFGDDFRFVSSGCVRVQDVRDYVAWLLKDNPGWGRDQIDEVIRSGAAPRRQADDSRSTSTGSTSPPGRRPTASCSSAPTSISATAPAPARSPPPSPPSRWRCRRNSGIAPPDGGASGGHLALNLFKSSRTHPDAREAADGVRSCSLAFGGRDGEHWSPAADWVCGKYRAAAKRTAMRRKVIVLAAMAALMPAYGRPWHAQAQIERGPAALAGAAQNYTPIEKAACGPRLGPIYAARGHHRVCGRYHCWCAPC